MLQEIGTAIAIASALKQAFSKPKRSPLFDLPDVPSEQAEINEYLTRYHTYAHEQLGYNRSKL